ncbi:MAG TPA: hypothetical protein V6C81_18070 [Planktothrix sp.]|jgi:hypothetical protein
MAYDAWTGKFDQYHWVQSNACLAWELFREVPTVIEGHYVVMASFDGCSLIDEMDNHDNSRWSDIGAPRLVASTIDLRWTGNGEEVFLFSEKPKEETLRLIADCPMIGQLRADDTDSSDVTEFLKSLTSVAPESFVGEGAWFFFCTKNYHSFQTFMNGTTIKQLPQRYEQERQRQLEHELKNIGPEVGPEKCAHGDCTKLRIALGVLCVEHHREMLARIKRLY